MDAMAEVRAFSARQNRCLVTTGSEEETWNRI